MEWFVVAAAGLSALLLVQYLRGARYERWQVGLGLVLGLLIAFAAIAGVTLLTSIFGEMQGLWLALVGFGGAAFVAGGALLWRLISHRQPWARGRAPFDFSSTATPDHVTSNDTE